jgi:hypothetical protein
VAAFTLLPNEEVGDGCEVRASVARTEVRRGRHSKSVSAAAETVRSDDDATDRVAATSPRKNIAPICPQADRIVQQRVTADPCKPQGPSATRIYLEESYRRRPWLALIRSLHADDASAQETVSWLAPVLMAMEFWVRTGRCAAARTFSFASPERHADRSMHLGTARRGGTGSCWCSGSQDKPAARGPLP